jgi:hypothetical protein
MSSSNQVRIAVIEEVVLGETPAAGDFSTARFISESLSGSPETTESQQIRTDRLASGQIVTGLSVGGDISFELAAEPVLDRFMESVMLSEFVADTPVIQEYTVDDTAKTITRDTGDFNTDVAVGDVLKLASFANAANNSARIIVAEIVSATVIRYVGVLVDEVAAAGSLAVCDKLEIGVDKKSFSIEKSFLDLDEKAIIYRGMYANSMNLSVSYGDIVNGSFGFVGVEYLTVDDADDFITDGRTITVPAVTQSLNGSIDMPLIISDVVGTIDGLEFCITSLEITLDNNNIAQTCIGRPAPKDYSFNTANISISISAYLADDNWDILAKKLTQESFAIGFILRNADGGYGFYMPAVQVSFDDPASGGPNQDIMLEMSGMAKVGENGEKSLYIFKL